MNQWDERYKNTEYVYGTEPNEFLKANLLSLPIGTILFPAEGEGRNAVFAASLGWTVDAFDQSVEGQKKALQLAELKNVSINYSLQLLEHWQPQADTYDCIALIFIHLPTIIRQQFHSRVIKALRPGGTLIFEAFSINQITKPSGGPKLAELLYTREEIESDFTTIELMSFNETQRFLNEGKLHQGIADLIQFSGRKQPY